MKVRLKRLKPRDHSIVSFSVPTGVISVSEIGEYRVGGKILALVEIKTGSEPQRRHSLIDSILPPSKYCLIVMDEIEGIGGRKVPLEFEDIGPSLVLADWREKPDWRTVQQVIRSYVRGELAGAIGAGGALQILLNDL